MRDRQRPIAKIVPFTVDEDDADDAALVAARLMRMGSGVIAPLVLESTPLTRNNAGDGFRRTR